MFRNIFSFQGRIRRTEFGISVIIFFISYFFIYVLTTGANPVTLFALLYLPMFWFIIAQGAKRCHDLNKSGWWQIIPFYVFWMLFENGYAGPNQYGRNPKVFNQVDPLLYRDDIYNGGGFAAQVAPIIADDLIQDSTYYNGDNNFIADNNNNNDFDNNFDNNSNNDSFDDDNDDDN